MGLLRFLLMLPVRVAGSMVRLLRLTGRWLRPVFGAVSWSAPGWAQAGAGVARRHPLRVGGIFFIVIALAIIGEGGWYWYRHHPRYVDPDLATFQVDAPAMTSYTGDDGKTPKITVYPLQVALSQSAAPIEMVGKPVVKGITMSPDLKGEWQWADDHTLRFTPASDWPVGAHVKVSFDAAQVFAPQIKVAENFITFDVPGFSAQATNENNSDFYQDPTNEALKQVIVPVKFNYPVDPAQFGRRVSLAFVGRDGKSSPLRFTITYDDAKLTAWVHSQPLDLPRDDSTVQFKLDSGVRSSRGGDGTDQAFQMSVRVPGLYSLAVDDVSPTLVDNDRYEPEQVLLMSLNNPVRGEDLAGFVKAWVLPKNRPDATQNGQNNPGNSGNPGAQNHPDDQGSQDDQDSQDSQDGDSSDAANNHYDWSTSEVSEAVLRQARPLALELIPTEDDHVGQQGFKFRAQPGERIYVRVAPGLKAFGGYRLSQASVQVVTVPPYPKLLSFMANGSLLSLNGSKQVSVVLRNLPGMKLEIGRVLPSQLQHLVNLRDGGSYAKPKLNFSYNFSEDYIVERFEQKRAFPTTDPGKANYAGIDLGQYLKAGKRGVFLLHLSVYDPVAEKKKKAAQAAQAAQAASGDDQDATHGDDDNDQASSGDRNNDSSNDDSESDNGNDNDNSGGDKLSDTRLIVLTDLGMVAKYSLDGSVDVFIQSIHTGSPVAGASVSVTAANGQALFTQATNADGVVHFPSFKGLEREKKPTLYIVKKGEDLSFLPISQDSDRQLDFSRFDVGGERNATSTGQLSAWMFSDRGIYRPGETFHVGMVVRAASWARSPAGVPLQAEIVDPRGITLKRQSVSVDATGFTDLQYGTSDTAPTGTWTVNLYVVKNGRTADDPIGSASVQVKEFLPDQMKVSAKLSQQVANGWVKPDGLKGIVDAQNLFGTPAQNRRVSASLTLRPAWPSFANWQDYQFFDAQRAQEGYADTLEDGKTDEHGHAEFSLDLKKYKNASYQLYFLSRTYDEESGRSVAANAQVMVSPNDWLVGYRSRDDLSYVPRGSARVVRLVAIDPQTKPVALKDLHAQLIEQRYVSVLTKQDSGAWQYVSREKEITVSDKPLAIPAGGMDYALPTNQPGSYALVIRRADQTEVNRIEFSVAGNANVTRSLDRNAELQIHLGKTDYAPGQPVDISIRAPYAGSGLITIERDKVYAHAWFHSNTTSSVQHITVPRDFEGNGYINVQYVRDPSSDEIFMSPLSYGVVPFSVNMDARRNALKVDVPPLVKPGQTVNFTVHSAHPAKVVVFAVDEGILQVAHYKLGDPLAFFFRKRMLEVRTAQILDLILPEFNKLMRAAAPGGDGDDAIGRQLNPFRRKHDQPAVYWSGIVEVNGSRTLSYTVPDSFNGRLRVMAVSVSPGQVGTFEGATTVRGDFVLSPNAPTTLAPGDEADVSVGVSNNLADGAGVTGAASAAAGTAGATGAAGAIPNAAGTAGKPGNAGKPMPVTVALKTGPQFQVSGAATQTLNLAPMHEGVVVFHIRATDQPGAGNLNFSARYGEHVAQQNVSVSVRPASPWRTQVDIARVDPGKEATMPVRQMYDPYASRAAGISTVPTVLSMGLGAYLVNYAHLCSEQMTSAAVPRLVARGWSAAPALLNALQPVYNGDETARGATPLSNDAAFALYLDAIRSRQNAQGGFGIWSATPDADPFVSAYVMHVLIDARERGLAVPQDMLDAGNQYLRKLADDDSLNGLDLLRQRAYAVYLLTREGNVTTNSLAAVQKRLQDAYPKDWQNDLAAAWLGASYKLLKADGSANQLMDGPQRVLERKPGSDASGNAYDEGYYIDPLTRDASVLYLLARHFPERARKLSPNVMENIAAPLADGEFNTLSSSMTLLALDTYARANATSLDRLGIDEIAPNGGAKAISSIQGNLLRAGSWSSAAARLRFVNGSAVPAWRITSQSGFDRGAPDKAIAQGLEIIREYTGTDGKPLKKITVGDEIDVHVKIRATNSKGLGNIAIVDLLPGGFDPVQSTVPGDQDDSSASSDDNDGGSGNGGGNGNSGGNAPYRSPFSQSGSTWQPDFVDVREDRVVIYGSADANVREFVYRIKASNAGRFAVPPAYGESMYDRRVQARSKGGAVLNVVRAP